MQEIDVAAELGNAVNQKQGTVMKCPNCGGNLKAFASSCELCGHELAGVSANRTIAEIVARFEAIESELDRAGVSGASRERELVTRRARIIRDFPIPNSRGDLQSLIYFIHPKLQSNLKPDANAEDWRVKFNEVMTLAKNAYKGDAKTRGEFEEIEKSLRTSIAGELKTKARRSPVLALAVGLIVLGVVVGLGMTQYDRWKGEQCDARYASGAQAERLRLDGILDSANVKVREKKYDDARAILAGLRWQFKEPCKVQETTAEQSVWDGKRQAALADIDKTREQDAAAVRDAAGRDQAERQAALDREQAIKREEAERIRTRQLTEKVNATAAERKATTNKEW
ncbi:hypothetical protein GHT07_04865 [Caenimonas koreensis DSM 17982]|uniref:Zinc-ribbon domain-containing protein n=1 Tax=Caenimonas koreensis DSM 17982 TaxID=1121255 RepID=A0A844B5K1_9BURK|nr:hypothetical protein [Caenimonas koreensis]MRD46596.1 hypothetical protein [Caenimonas koreensis DSM 17982]